MESLTAFVKVAAVMAASVMLGRMFLAECRQARAAGRPWYRPYFSIPGLLIVALLIGLPFFVWLAGRGG